VLAQLKTTVGTIAASWRFLFPGITLYADRVLGGSLPSWPFDGSTGYQLNDEVLLPIFPDPPRLPEG